MRSGVILTLVGIAASSLPAAAAPSGPPKSISIEESHDMGIDLDHLKRSREHGNHYDLLGESSGMVTADTDSQNYDRDFYEQAHKYHSAYKDYYANHYEGPKGIARARAYLETSALKLRDLQKERKTMREKGLQNVSKTGKHHSPEQLEHDHKFAEGMKEQNRALAMIDAFKHHK